MRQASNTKPIAGRIRCLVGEVRRVPHHFFRHTADIDASAAESGRLKQNHARPILRGAPGTGHTAATTTDDKQIILSHYQASTDTNESILTVVANAGVHATRPNATVAGSNFR